MCLHDLLSDSQSQSRILCFARSEGGKYLIAHVGRDADVRIGYVDGDGTIGRSSRNRERSAIRHCLHV